MGRMNGKGRQVPSVADVMDDSRSKVSAMVEREWILTRSWMLAYENVGARIGRSSSWVQKLLSSRLETKRPDHIARLNIQACYARICERVEAGNDQAVERIRVLEGNSNAAAQSDLSAAVAPDQGMVAAPKTVAPEDDLVIPQFLRRPMSGEGGR